MPEAERVHPIVATGALGLGAMQFELFAQVQVRRFF
jgi:hypothetical protein